MQILAFQLFGAAQQWNRLPLNVKCFYYLRCSSRAQWSARGTAPGTSTLGESLNHRVYHSRVHTLVPKLTQQTSNTTLNIINPMTKDAINGWYLKWKTKYIIIRYLFRIFIERTNNMVINILMEDIMTNTVINSS